jgi:hypothetical protein
MNAYKVEATVTENGTIVLHGLPFQVGDTVEVIVLEQAATASAQASGGFAESRDAIETEYLTGVSLQMAEWASVEDEVAYHDL